MNTFAELLNSLVKNNPNSISFIAKKAQISRPSLYDLLNGKTLPRLITLNNLLTALSLSENSEKQLKEIYQSERLKHSRKHQEDYFKEKKRLLTEISSQLLLKGYEIARPSEADSADLILRVKNHRIPVLICPTLYDHCTNLGKILKIMFSFSVKQGYIFTDKINSQDRSFQPLFQNYGIKILSKNSILKELR
tara:strand:- start:46 stop:624 length:579 start_codon:yes stop_codon:yes gene_type:complete